MNKFGKRLMLSLAAGTAIAVPVAVVSFQGSGVPGSAPLFTPVQLANGLAFNQGAAAPYLAAFERPQVRLSGKLLAVERSVDAALRADPVLARRFAGDVQSGRTGRVAVALRVLGRLTRAAFGEVFGRASGRRMTAWAKQTPQDVAFTAAASDSGASDPGSDCSTCVVNTPPPTVTGPPPVPPTTIPPFTPLPPITPLTFPPLPPAPPTWLPPAPCSTCVVNTPPATVTGRAQGAAEVSVPSGVALSLPYLIARPYRAERAGRKDMTETIALVAFSLNAD